MIKLCLTAICTVVALSGFGTMQAGAFDAAADFSITSNPNGPWSYGLSNTLGGFTPYTGSGSFVGNPALPAWLGFAPGSVASEPWVTKNISHTPQTGSGLQLTPGNLAFHPGPQGQFSIVRWTAPNDGMFAIDGFFESADRFVGASVDVHVLENGISLLDTDLIGPLGTQTGFDFERTLSFGDTIDFVVGFGPNDNFYHDSTVLSATITPIPTESVPESSSLLALAGLFFFIYCRQKHTKLMR